MTNNEKINFEQKGIGELLAQTFLEVPLNQREYSWEEEHVRELFTDFSNAISKQSIHFLGTIVLTGGAGDKPEVSDGQQRLATTIILLAAIRDYFWHSKDDVRARTAETEYLMKTDIRTTDIQPKLRLNTEDCAFFEKRILSNPDSADRKVQATKESHKRIEKAAEIAAEFIANMLGTQKDKYKTERLIELLQFVNIGAQVIVLRVPDHMNAFMMFETLNDRGLKASQVDLLKNYLLSESKSRIRDAQQNWAKMCGILETLGESDITLTFLHHLLITKEGPTKANEVFNKVKQTVNSQTTAIQFLNDLAEGANDYVALFNPDNLKWNAYGTNVRKSISTINTDLRVTQIRPLMFAVARHFSVKEAEKAFRRFISWSVRILIIGTRGGLLDRNYSICAQQIGTGKIKTAEELTNALIDIIPTDAMFETAFSEARVSQTRLARYYLRAMELKRQGNPEPEWVPNEERAINLEHILPESPQANWSNVNAEVADAFYNRMGNLVLLQATANSTIGNLSFSDKKAVLGQSGYSLTSDVAKYDKWGVDQIETRQRRLAEFAVKTWPIKA